MLCTEVAKERLKVAALGIGVGILGLSGCIVEEDKECGKNQVFVDGDGTKYCECAPGFILNEALNSCTPCGENEEVKANACVCKQGFTRPSEAAECSASALGQSCTGDSECGGDFPLCAEASAAGYCTSACATSNDCQPGFVCDESVCEKAPEGYGKTCESSADCAGTSATYCDAYTSKSCIVSCSATAPCPGDWVCCDITLASAVICVPPGGLTDGMCPAGGKVVKP